MLSATIRFLVYSVLVASLSAWTLESVQANPLALKYCDVKINGVNVTRHMYGSTAPTRDQCIEVIRDLRKRDSTDAALSCECYLGATA